ncbi:MAG: methyltransferase domain-containing protein [Ignavibacteriales bacterium]|nr:methyltransferase domain-containing protein [Ignavibacteriales bacterium]
MARIRRAGRGDSRKVSRIDRAHPTLQSGVSRFARAGRDDSHGRRRRRGGGEAGDVTTEREPTIRPDGADTSFPKTLAKRTRLILDALPDPNGTRLIDLGCGAGGYTLALLELGLDATGVEIDDAKVEEFRRRAPDRADRVTLADLADAPFPDASFDAALLNEVIEHAPDERAALAEARRLLKPGGTLIVFAPNRLYPFETHGVYRKNSDRRLPFHTPFVPYVPNALARRWWRPWARNYFPWELRALVREAGFRIEKTAYVWQAFDGAYSPTMPAPLRFVAKLAQAVAPFAERLPLVNRFGAVSTMVVGRRG